MAGVALQPAAPGDTSLEADRNSKTAHRQQEPRSIVQAADDAAETNSTAQQGAVHEELLKRAQRTQLETADDVERNMKSKDTERTQAPHASTGTEQLREIRHLGQSQGEYPAATPEQNCARYVRAGGETHAVALRQAEEEQTQLTF